MDIKVNDTSNIVDNVKPASSVVKSKDISIGKEVDKNMNYMMIGKDEKSFLLNLLKENFNQFDTIEKLENILYSEAFEYIEMINIGNRTIIFTDKGNNTICSNFNWLPKKLSIDVIMNVTKNINIISKIVGVKNINILYRHNKILAKFKIGE